MTLSQRVIVTYYCKYKLPVCRGSGPREKRKMSTDDPARPSPHLPGSIASFDVPTALGYLLSAVTFIVHWWPYLYCALRTRTQPLWPKIVPQIVHIWAI